MKYLLLTSLLLIGCASPQYLTDKDSWISVGQSVYYCERITIKSVLLPVCVQASLVSDWVRLEKFQKPETSK